MCGLYFCSCTIGVSEIDNLFDPQDPNYVSPSTAIFSGPLDDDILDSNIVVFSFRHSNNLYWPDSSNVLARIAHQILYSFRVDNRSWSSWHSGEDLLLTNLSFWSYDSTTGMHTIIISNLEDKHYSVEIRSQYPTNITEKNWPIINFDVNVSQGPELFISPGHAFIDSGSTFFVFARVNDVVDFMGAHIELAYPPNELKLINFFLEDNTNDFLLQNNGYVISMVESDTIAGTFIMNLGVAGGNNAGVTGSGKLVRFIFYQSGPIVNSIIELSSLCTIRDIYNNSVLQRVQSGIITVWP